MKISDPNGRPLAGLGQSNKIVPSNGSSRSATPEGHSSAADRVQLSNLSAHLSASQGDSAARLKRLSSLESAVLSGGYQVDAGMVSESIIRYSLEFEGGNYL